ncbi:MAG: ABC-2 family transporter protein [Bacilli bacterium]|nr:ABC-2 family transporter protein [Bacilli bacterium]
MRSYLSYFKLRIITNIQYRAAALAGVSTQLFFGFMYILFYIALYESNAGISAPMSLENVISYMWLGQAFYALRIPVLKDSELLNMIKDGNLAYEIIRPQDFYFKFYIKLYAHRLISVMLRFFPIVIVSVLLPKPYNLGAPTSIGAFIIFLVILVLSSFLITALSILVHLLTIFTIDSRGVFSFYAVIGELFMGGIVPIPFLPKILRIIAYILPFRFLSDFPYRIYMGDISISSGINLIPINILWIIVIVLIGYMVSKIALRKAVIQGG